MHRNKRPAAPAAAAVAALWHPTRQRP